MVLNDNKVMKMQSQANNIGYVSVTEKSNDLFKKYI